MSTVGADRPWTSSGRRVSFASIPSGPNMIDAWLDLPDWQIVAVLLVAFTFSGIL
jgi:hypothetical protein